MKCATKPYNTTHLTLGMLLHYLGKLKIQICRYFDGIQFTVPNSIAVSKRYANNALTNKHILYMLTKTTFSYVMWLHFGKLWIDMQVMLCFDLCLLGAVVFQLSSGKHILNPCIVCLVFSRRVASHMLRLPSSVHTTHAAHPSPTNHYNDPIQGSKTTTVLFHSCYRFLTGLCTAGTVCVIAC